jgi:signal peptidase I
MNPKEDIWLEGLRQGWSMRFRPLGCSMAPFLRSGDIVTIVPKFGRIGDIVLTNTERRLILHRVVAKIGDRIITKGDSLDHLDSPVTLRDVIGKAVARERDQNIFCLEPFWVRLIGLAFSLTVPFVPKLVPAIGCLKALLQPRLAFK